MSRLEIKVVFKMRQDSLFITTVVSLVINHKGKNVLGLLLNRVGQGFCVFSIQGRFKSGIRYIAA